MTTPIFKLTKGARNIDLQTGRYRVYSGWAPPPVSEIPLFAEGTSASRNGAVLVDRRPVNRQTTLPVNVRGSSDAEIRRGISDLQMLLSLAGDEYEPLYLEFRPNSDTPEPIWGNYGTNLRYEIIHGVAAISERYGRGNLIATSADVSLTLTVKPYALGRPQQLGSAMGGIVEDTIGSVDGASIGLRVPAATPSGGNKFTNPVFGYATWNNGWTAAANIIAAQNTSRGFCFPGCFSSAFLIAVAGTSNTFYQTFNVGNTNTHYMSAYVMRPDLGAVTSSDCGLLYNNSLQTTTYTSMGNGVYLLTASFSGVNAASINGVIVSSDASIYLLAIQIVEASVFHPMTTGDMLGCAWSGTAHATASTRDGARLRWRISDVMKRGQGSIRIVWKSDRASSAYATNGRLFDFDTNNFYGRWNSGSTYWQFSDGTNTVNSSSTSITTQTVYIFHFVYGPAGLTIYLNGSSIATGATFAPQTAGTYLLLGNGGVGTESSFGMFMDLATFDVQLSAAQVLADYTNIAQLTADGQRVGAIPWLWTKDGDDVVDNCNDSTRDNWAVAGGVPGSADARTEIYCTKSSSSAITMYLGQSPFDYGDWLAPITRGSYEDFSGSADANSSGGERKQEAGVAAYQEYSAITNTAHPITGKAHVIARLGGTGGNWTVNSYFSYSLTGAAFGATSSKTVAAPAALTGYYFGSALMPVVNERSPIAQLYAVLIGSIGGGVTGYTDLLMVVFGRLMKVSTTATYTGLFIDGLNGAETNSSVPSNPVNVFGDPVELSPNKANTITSILLDSSDAWTITRTLTFDKIQVTPRYSLL